MKTTIHQGFTLVELLTCIAIVALLAIIAVPNFSRAQTTTNIAKAKADLQSLKVGLEAYKTDLGAYPWMNSLGSALDPGEGSTSYQPTLERLTTPISYLNNTAPFYDHFEGDMLYQGPTLAELRAPSESEIPFFKQYFYNARNLRDTSAWGQNSPQDTDPVWYFLESAGPDKCHNSLWQLMNRMSLDLAVNRALLGKTIYDATNGTISRGSIWELGGTPEGYGTSMAYMINSANSSAVGEWPKY